jgi:hypothetical protein
MLTRRTPSGLQRLIGAMPHHNVKATLRIDGLTMRVHQAKFSADSSNGYAR